MSLLIIDDMERVISAKLLGVVFRKTLKWTLDMHVNFVSSRCKQKLYLLQLLRSQELLSFQLDHVSHAITISRLYITCLVRISVQ